VRAVADHGDAAAAGLRELIEEVDLLDPFGESLLVRRHLVEHFGVGDDDEPPLRRGDADR
jgi:hypothetical protein